MAAEDAEQSSRELISRVDEVSEALEGLLSALSEDEDLNPSLERLVHTALWAIPDADAVSLTIVEGDGPLGARTAAATHELVVDIDRDQYAAGEGPCLEAARERKPIRVDVQEAAQRWPDFVRSATLAGVKAYLSAPLVFSAEDDEVIGALNVYGFTAGAFDPIDESLLRLLTTTATAAISGARRYLHCREITEQLNRALTSRAEIDQAKGALMAVHGIDAEQAFAMLVAQSQHQNVKLLDVARGFLRSLRQS